WRGRRAACKDVFRRNAAPARRRARPAARAEGALSRRADHRARPGGPGRHVARDRAAGARPGDDDPAHDPLSRGGRPARLRARDRRSRPRRHGGQPGRAQARVARRHRASRTRGSGRRECNCRRPASLGHPRADDRCSHPPRPRRQRGSSNRLGHLRPRVQRPAGRIGDDRAPVSRRRLPPSHGSLVPGGGRREEGGGRVTALRHTEQVALRYTRALLRTPAWVGISLVQPVIWLLLFGALFKRTVDIPGFTAGSYVEFLTPGIVVMLAISTAGWVGMGFIDDINRGTMDRLLVSPIWRGALNLGSVAQSVLTISVQSVIVILLSIAVGARLDGGIAGIAVLVVVASLLGAVFASLSNGLAVLTRHRETLIGAVTTVTLPLVFLSSSLMQQSLLPGWIRWLARFNPVDWAAVAGRSATQANADWSLIASRTGFLVLLLVASAAFATRAFSAYQRSI